MTHPSSAVWELDGTVEGATLSAMLDVHLRGRSSGADVLRPAVHAVAQRAHRDGMTPQQLLIGMKTLFRASAQYEANGMRVEALLERAITWAIRGYYASADAPAPASGD